jgi:2-polyprenyl-3-methyl-5-hydroxy-6-metoxy-1,4-benzoquinol methylase
LLHDEWYVGFHTGLAARFWRAAGATMAQADLEVITRLMPAPPARVLDVPCGDGRIADPLERAGYDVTGVDIVQQAPRFVQGDLRALPRELGTFDVVISWGNSFGYTTPLETERSLRQFKERLEPGGLLILESLTIAEGFLTSAFREHAAYTFGGITMAATNSYNPLKSRLESEWVFTDADGRTERASGVHHVHTTGEVVRMLEAAGFTEIALKGPDGTRDYALGDKRMIAVAR